LATIYRPAEDGFAAETVAAYRKVCVTIGAKVRATVSEGKRIEGEAVEIDDAGGLVVRSGRGLEVVRSGEIEDLR
jgi:BirA family biotin operon repressor/biotin-[acetyl-CoA-carboxylase] ligase